MTSVKAGELQPRFIPGKEQPADFLTKPLLGPAFVRCREAVGMVRLATFSGMPVLTDRSSSCNQVSAVQGVPAVQGNEQCCVEQAAVLAGASLPDGATTTEVSAGVTILDRVVPEASPVVPGAFFDAWAMHDSRKRG